MNPIPTKQMRLLTEMNKIFFRRDGSLNNWNKNCFKNKSFQLSRFENPKNVIAGHHKINSFRNKFESLKPFTYNAIDIF